MGEFLLESQFFGLFLSLAFFQLARWLNRKAGREVISPLLFATLLCIAVLLVFDIDFEVYNRGAQYLDVLLTPATICLAIPLYRQYELLRRNAVAVLAGSVAGVAAHMAGCLLMLAVFRLEAAEGTDLREAVFRVCAREDLPLLELRRDAMTLEDIFLKLTSDDPAAPQLENNRQKEEEKP